MKKSLLILAIGGVLGFGTALLLGVPLVGTMKLRPALSGDEIAAAQPQALADLAKVLAAARAPAPAPAPKNIYDRLELKSGDIISAINEQPVSNPRDAMIQLQHLSFKTDQLKTVTIVRGGQRMNIRVD